MKKKFLLSPTDSLLLNLLIVLCMQVVIPNLLKGQDAALCGWNTQSPDGFAIVALKDLSASQPIYVTDRSYDSGSNSFPSGESIVRVTWTGTWSEGTIISISETSSNTFSIATSANGPSGAGVTLVTGSFSYSFGEEGLSVFTASSTTDPGNNVTEIYSFLEGFGTTDINPNTDADCPCSTDFVAMEFNNINADGGNLNAGVRNSTTLSTFTTASNWTTSTSNQNYDMTEFTNLQFGGSGILPVELTSFTVSKQGAHSLLNWQTDMEVNNDYFEVERSVDGRNYEVIHKVTGHGNSSERHEYEFMDTHPLADVNYYRLKQVDFDGKYRYSSIKLLNFSLLTNELQLFPNPFKNYINIRIPENGKSASELQKIVIYNQNGKLVHEEGWSVQDETMTIDLSALPTGIYTVQQVIGRKVMLSQKVVKGIQE